MSQPLEQQRPILFMQLALINHMFSSVAYATSLIHWAFCIQGFDKIQIPVALFFFKVAPLLYKVANLLLVVSLLYKVYTLLLAISLLCEVSTLLVCWLASSGESTFG